MPLVNFRVAIAKNEATGAIVVTGGQIDKPGGIGHVRDQPPIIDAVGMFVHQQPNVGRPRPGEAGTPDVLDIIRIPVVDSRAAGRLAIANKAGSRWGQIYTFLQSEIELGAVTL